MHTYTEHYHIHTCIHRYIHTYKHTYTEHYHIHTYIHTQSITTYKHTYIHTYIHTQSITDGGSGVGEFVVFALVGLGVGTYKIITEYVYVYTHVYMYVCMCLHSCPSRWRNVIYDGKLFTMIGNQDYSDYGQIDRLRL